MSAVKVVRPNTQLDAAVLRVVALGENLMIRAQERIEKKKTVGHSLNEFMGLVALEAALLDSVLQLISPGAAQGIFKAQYRYLSKRAGTPDELEGYA